tara:strand:+ start:112 stop:312 length:201 start_codon:yes stop_codon:yes gene_type:complete
MNVYTVVCGDEIHCNGVLMMPHEIIEMLTKAEELASIVLLDTKDKVEIPKKAIKSQEAFMAWLMLH